MRTRDPVPHLVQTTLSHPLAAATTERAAKTATPASAAYRHFARLLSPSIADVIFLGCLALTLLAGSLMLSADGDPARHITVGTYILDTGAIPSHDVFSHTMAGQPFVPYEWLSELSSALAFRTFGTAGPVLLHGGLIALTFAGLYCHLRRRGHGPLIAVTVTMACASVSTVHWLARPHVFTFVGTMFFAAVLDGWRGGWLSRRALWFLPPAMLVWSNTHGGFLIGAILLGASLVVDLALALIGSEEVAAPARTRLRQLAPPTAATLAATLLNPAGFGLWTHVTAYFGKSLLVTMTDEYRAPSLHDHSVRPFFALFGIAIAGLVFRRGRPGLYELALTGAFSFFALYSARNIPLFAIVTAPYLALSLQRFDLRATLTPRVAGLLQRSLSWLRARDAAYTRLDARASGHMWPVTAVVLLLAAAIATPTPTTLGIEFDPTRQPVAAVTALKQSGAAGNLFNELQWGGYLLHELWPTHHVFIDGQTDFYGEDLTRTYLQVRDAALGWQAVFETHDVRIVLLPPGAPLVRELRRTPGWRLIHEDRVAAVLAR